MADSTETKKYGKVLAVVAVVGLLVLVPLVWLAMRMSDEGRQRRVVAANEAETISILEGIAAAEQLYLQTNSRYGTFRELVEAGVFRAPLTGDTLVAHGYNFTLRVTPRTEAEPPSFKVNADPLSREGAQAIGDQLRGAGDSGGFQQDAHGKVDKVLRTLAMIWLAVSEWPPTRGNGR